MCATGNGSIQGCINFVMAGHEHSIVLLPISVDVLDFCRPHPQSDSEFRTQWTLLEWENKLNIDVSMERDLKSCLQVYEFLAESMKLSRVGQKVSDADYLAGNLSGRTIFGEEIMVNVCLEKNLQASRITGHLRLRSRSQDVAMALGDRILSLLKPFKL